MDLLPSYGCSELFSGALNPEVDISRDNSFQDDPSGVCDGSLVGPDGLLLKDVFVEDGTVRKGISESILSSVVFRPTLELPPVTSTVPCCALGVPTGNDAVFAADSGTRYTLMTMSTAQHWGGKALARLMFMGVAGSPFPVFGGDDLIVYMQDVSDTWRLKNFGKAFVSPHANLDLASSYEMQTHELGTVFELDGSAWLIDRDGVHYPLFRKNGLWQFQIRFPLPEPSRDQTAFQAASQYAKECPGADLNVPGSFASKGACSRKCCSSLNVFEHVAAGGCSCCTDEVFVSGGSPGEFLVEGIEMALPSGYEIKKGELARVMQRVANMKKWHLVYKHAPVDVLNGYVRDGTITDGIILQSISCKICDIARAEKAKVSKKFPKSYPLKPFHVVQGDIFEAEGVLSRSKFKYVLAFIDVASGAVY